MERRKNSRTQLHTLQQRVKFLAGLFYNPRFYRIINDVFKDPSKLDLTLGTLCYSALFVSSVLGQAPRLRPIFVKMFQQIKRSFFRLLLLFAKRFKNKKYETELLKWAGKKEENQHKDKEVVPEGNGSSSVEKTAEFFKEFSNYLTDIRIFNRGFTIPGCIADILEAGALLKEKDYLNFVSTWCISLYQPFETIAFLFDHNWLLRDRAANNCNWWYAVSTRFWFVWVIAEFAQLSHKLFVVQRGRNMEKEEIIGFLEHLATLPLCVHWSLEDGCLSPLNVGLFGTIAGGLSTLDMWRDVWKGVVREISH